MEIIHRELLETMDVVHKICVDNDINYQIAYGSGIGAIREKGFIPWDDDIDIVMDRESYNKWEKVTAELKIDGFEIVTDKTHPKNYFNIAKVYKINEKIIHRNNSGWRKNLTGVFIDIHIADRVPNNKIMRKAHRAMLYICATLIFLKGDGRLSRKWKHRNLIYIVILPVKLVAKLIPLKLIKFIRNTILKMGRGKYSAVAISPAIYNQTLFPYEWIKKSSLVNFEDRQYYISDYAKEMLTMRYGDYMTPVDEDNSHLIVEK